MSKQSGSNIVHLYFKKTTEEGTILLKINPIHLRMIEIVVPKEGEPESSEAEITAGFESELAEDGFLPSSPLEFNLYWSGLV